MTDLIARLEAATEGSRELDVAIYVLERPFPCVELTESTQEAIDYVKAPHYTTSIDAALTLVPEGFRLDRLHQSWPGSAWRCELYRANGNTLEISSRWHVREAATPALALCIAALKARHA